MKEFFRNFFSNQAFFERSMRGTLLGGALLASQAAAMPGGLTWESFATAGLGMLAGMVAAGQKNPPKN